MTIQRVFVAGAGLMGHGIGQVHAAIGKDVTLYEPELARAEAKVETGRTMGAVALEVLANVDAMQLALDAATAVDRFGEAEIKAIHRRLMARSINAARIAGQVRSTQNWIGGNNYNPCCAALVPPPPEEVGALLDDLGAGVNDERLPPVVQAALVHAQFETIHPFADGNGRAGRALIHVILKRRRLAPAYVPPISVVLAAERDRYIAGLTRFRGERVSDWIEQFAAAALRAAMRAPPRRSAADAFPMRASSRSRFGSWSAISTATSPMTTLSSAYAPSPKVRRRRSSGCSGPRTTAAPSPRSSACASRSLTSSVPRAATP